MQGPASSFGADLDFLQRHTETVVLSDPSGAARLVLCPAEPAYVRPFSDRAFPDINSEFVPFRYKLFVHARPGRDIITA